MKKLFLLLAASGLLFFFVASCGARTEEKTPDSLTGTTWVSVYQEADGFTETTTLTFTATRFANVFVDSEGDGGDLNGTYTYHAPNILLTDDLDGRLLVGTVKGNKMTFDEDQEMMIFIRQ